MTDTIGIIIPAYEPDIQILSEYIRDIKLEIDPSVIRVEIDDPLREHVDHLQDIAEVNVATSRRGKGGAITDGFDALETDILAFADADGSVSASSLEGVIRHITSGTADISIGSRRHPSSQIEQHQSVVRRLLGDIFAYTAQKILPVHCHDYQCGAKAVHSEAWDTIGHHCYEPGFAWDLEFVSVAGSLGYEITEAPIEWEDHPDSTVDPISTSIELATALLDVKRRTDTIATSPRFRKIQATEHSKLKKGQRKND